MTQLVAWGTKTRSSPPLLKPGSYRSCFVHEERFRNGVQSVAYEGPVENIKHACQTSLASQ